MALVDPLLLAGTGKLWYHSPIQGKPEESAMILGQAERPGAAILWPVAAVLKPQGGPGRNLERMYIFGQDGPYYGLHTPS